jgi:ankyrin repeat protein
MTRLSKDGVCTIVRPRLPLPEALLLPETLDAFKKIESENNADAKLGLLLDFEKQFPQSKLLLDVYQYMIVIYEQKNDQPKLLAVRAKAVAFDRRQRLGGGATLQKGAVTTGGITALILAIREGNLESARILLAAGADVNTKMANGSSALLVAILNGHYSLAAFLLDHGADPNIADKDGKAPLYAAVEMRNYQVTDTPGPQADKAEALDLTKTLLNHGADPNARLTAKPPYRGGINRTWLPEPGATPFYRAAVSGDVTAMRLLLAYGADPYIAANDNTTPLMVAAGVGFMGRETYVWSEREALEALQLCLELGYNVNAGNATGLTALHGAAFRGWNAAVQILVNKGAKLDAKDKAGRIPLNWADGSYKNSRQPDTIVLIRKLMESARIPITTATVTP